MGWDNILLLVAEVAAAVALALGAAVLLAGSAEERDLATRMRELLRPGGLPPPRRGATLAATLGGPFRKLGEKLSNGTMMSERDRGELERAAAAAGLDPQRAVPTLMGLKAVLAVAGPLLAYLYARQTEADLPTMALLIAGALMFSVMGPNRGIGLLQSSYQKALRRALPDALDLMVVCAEAGLGMETAVDRVAREMAPNNRAIAVEFNVLVQELRMLPDRNVALQRLGERTGIDGFARLGTTLGQTLRYGTPLAQALRVLSADMRQTRMLAIEEQAVRLPTLLVVPMILFIMPALFIVLVGPAIIEVGVAMGN